MLTYVVKTKGDNSIIAFFLQGGYNRFDDYYYGRYRDIRYPDRVHVLHHLLAYNMQSAYSLDNHLSHNHTPI